MGVANIDSYRAMLVREMPDGSFARDIVAQTINMLPPGDVLVRVHYASLNYKDALSASGNKGVTRRYPHTPGIDAAGVVEQCATGEFQPGDEVLIGSAEFGANAPGGFSQYARVPAGWVTRLPRGLSLRESMAYGTAGITAALSVLRLQAHGVASGSDDVLVTGATGGEGSIAVAILAKLGYAVVAATGKLDQRPLLTRLGAREVIHRDELNDTTGKPLLKGRWAGVVDTVGGNFLATALKSTRYGGVVTACGNAASPELSMTVYPFILRAVSLIGIDVANCTRKLRQQLWERLAGEWRLSVLDQLVHECPLDQLSGEIDRMLHGQHTGRVVVKLS
jgi:putative YhdH/YhfP family quinone oxidoreductase